MNVSGIFIIDNGVMYVIDIKNSFILSMFVFFI